MARVTVEDCLQHVKNRFELVMLASKRARQLMRGSVEPTVAWENDKPTVVALREIATGHTDFSDAHQVEEYKPSDIFEDLAVSEITTDPAETFARLDATHIELEQAPKADNNDDSLEASASDHSDNNE